MFNNQIKNISVAAIVFAGGFFSATSSAQTASRYGNTQQQDVGAYGYQNDCFSAPPRCGGQAGYGQGSFGPGGYGQAGFGHMGNGQVRAKSSRYGSVGQTGYGYQSFGYQSQGAPMPHYQMSNQYQMMTQSPHQMMYNTQSVMPAQNCPAGTTSAGDGTCLQTGQSSTVTTSSSAHTQTQQIELYAQQTTTPASCPAGTTASSDGTCLQGSTSTYETPTYQHQTPVSCPAGTTAASDGTCLQGSTSYETPGSVTPSYPTPPLWQAPVYKPIRK